MQEVEVTHHSPNVTIHRRSAVPPTRQQVAQMQAQHEWNVDTWGYGSWGPNRGYWGQDWGQEDHSYNHYGHHSHHQNHHRGDHHQESHHSDPRHDRGHRNDRRGRWGGQESHREHRSPRSRFGPSSASARPRHRRTPHFPSRETYNQRLREFLAEAFDPQNQPLRETPAKPEEVATLERRRPTPQEIKLKSCPICLENYKFGSDLIYMDCGHEFDEECLIKWLKLKDTCPLCRVGMDGLKRKKGKSPSSPRFDAELFDDGDPSFISEQEQSSDMSMSSVQMDEDLDYLSGTDSYGMGTHQRHGSGSLSFTIGPNAPNSGGMRPGSVIEVAGGSSLQPANPMTPPGSPPHRRTRRNTPRPNTPPGDPPERSPSPLRLGDAPPLGEACDRWMACGPWRQSSRF